MKILVLGNGFDLDHNLPTSYGDFLDFCNSALELYTPYTDEYEKLNEKQQQYIDTLKNDEDSKNYFLNLIRKNCLLTYFNKQRNISGQNWIDFETEIKNIVNEFRSVELELQQSQKSQCKIDSYHRIYAIIDKLGFIPSSIDFVWDEVTLRAMHKTLLNALNDFSKALNYYVAKLINKTKVKGVSPDIIEFGADNVLTFNYSNTYERVYGGVRWNEKVDYVHGIANEDYGVTPNIILGITSKEIDIDDRYVEFEKYYQRITKKTGNDYKKWLQTRFAKNGLEVLFFGHSLDVTDSDIIKDLICYESATTTICYHNDEAHRRIVANLIRIIGKDKLIQYVSGENPKIIFKEQRTHQSDNTAGVQIERDIRKLYKLYNLSNKEIDTLLNRIKKKINAKDLTYFYSQRKAIDLFEALQYQCIEKIHIEDFFEICKCLEPETNRKGKLRYFFMDEWSMETPWGEEKPCAAETIKLIGLVNKTNEISVEEVNSNKLYSIFAKLNTSKEIKEALIGVFSEENPDEKYWVDLEELIRCMINNELFREAFDLIRKEKLSVSVRSKFLHFESEYWYESFEYQMEEQTKEQNKESEEEKIADFINDL